MTPLLLSPLFFVAQAADFEVVTVDLRTQQLTLLGQSAGVHTIQDAHARAPAAQALTNAGIFHTPTDPVGLQIEAGQTTSPFTAAAGSGNFFLKPNGVFYIDASGAHTVTSDTWASAPPAGVQLATQSGPMLLIAGQPHPAFNASSPNQRVRSGVCASDPQTVHLFISTRPVRFYETAVYARDTLKCTDALYLDGVISALWTPGDPLPAPSQQYAGVFVVSTAPAATD